MAATNGTYWQSIAEYLGANEPVNGNWSQTIYEQLTSINGESLFFSLTGGTISGNTNVTGSLTIGASSNTGNIEGVNDFTGGKGLKYSDNVDSQNYSIMGDKAHYTVVAHSGDFEGLWAVYGTNSKKIEISNASLNEHMTIDSGTAPLYINGTDVNIYGTTVNISSLPTSDAGLSTGDLYTQTATQLGGTGTTKVLCIK